MHRQTFIFKRLNVKFHLAHVCHSSWKVSLSWPVKHADYPGHHLLQNNDITVGNLLVAKMVNHIC